MFSLVSQKSSLQPKTFSEHVGRVYYTKNSDEEEKDAKECFKWWRLGMVSVYGLFVIPAELTHIDTVYKPHKKNTI